MKWRQYGRNGVLIEFAEKPGDWAFQKCHTITEALTRKRPPRLVEFVPGYTTVLLEFDLSGDCSIDTVAAEAVQLLTHAVRHRSPPGALKTIPVRYDGPDLERVAKHNRLSIDQVIALHSGATYKVYLLGFSPGFPYLGELHPRLHTPRLDSPRARVAAGSVGIGGNHTGIYSVESPGGWNILGRTDVRIFDPSSAAGPNPEKAFLLAPGDRVRFVPIP